MRAVAGLAIAFTCLSVPALAAPKADLLTCTSFMRQFPQTLPGFRVSFERPLTITRDLFGGDESGVDIHVLSTDAEVDGTLRCRGDDFQRFEVKIGTPADAPVESNFTQFEQATLMATLHFDKNRAATAVNAMSSDAAEYLRASIERGDTYKAGKVEYHQGGAYDLGVIWTPADKTLIVTTQADD